MTLLKDYLNQWATFEDERLYLLKKLDSSIMKTMLKNNIPLDEVKKSIRDNSSLCKGKSFIAIKKYIANQLKQDQEMDQLSLFDPRDPFTGSK